MTPELQKATAALNAAKREIQKIEDEKNRLEVFFKQLSRRRRDEGAECSFVQIG